MTAKQKIILNFINTTGQKTIREVIDYCAKHKEFNAKHKFISVSVSYSCLVKSNVLTRIGNILKTNNKTQQLSFF